MSANGNGFLSYAWLRLGFPYLRCDLSVPKFTLNISVVIAQNYALNESIVNVRSHREFLSYEFTMLAHR